MSAAWQDAVGWALIHSVWQGAVVGVLLAAALRLMRRASSGARYVAGCVALAAMMAAPVATAAWLVRGDAPETAGVGSRETTLRPPGWSAAAVALGIGPGEAPSHGAPPRALAWRTPLAVEPAVPWLVRGWAVGVALLSLRLLGGWLWLRRLARSALLPAPEEWHACVARTRARLRIRRPVAVFLSPRVSGPSLVGWLRPVILMPLSASSGLSPRQVELILLHELVHVRRWDALVNLLQRLAETVLFYHPATWWVSARIREEREHCCDDAVVARAGVHEYVLALLALEEGRAPALALGAGGPSLLGRVRRLVDPRAAAAGRGRSPARAAVAGAALLALAAVLAAAPAGAAAESRDAGPAGSAPAGEARRSCGADGLTLCAELGATVETLLREAGVPGVAIVQEVATGGVLAYAQASRGGRRGDLTEPVLPASLWKLALAAVWWERGRGSARIDCPASLRVGSAMVRNGGAEGVGPIAVPEEMLALSCNTAAVEMTLRLGRDGGAARLGGELRRLGFPVARGGEGPGADTAFWASTSPAFRARMAPASATVAVEDDTPDALAALALGTARVRVTPLHLSRFLQAVGNGGVMHAPTVESGLAGRGGGTRVMSEATAAHLRRAMLRAVDGGTAHAAAGTQPPGWALGGKTGTAGGRPGEAADGWFAGLVVDPAGRPRYTVLVHLHGGGPGGERPTRLAARIARSLALGEAR